jgi:flagellar biosynthesis protein FlhG
MMNNNINNYGHQKEHPHPLIVSFISGKGGVGKTAITFNLGYILASAGYRTLLVDCDWYFGNLHILANVVPKHNLGELIENPSLGKEVATAVSENLFLIASPSVGDSEINYQNKEYAVLLSGVNDIYSDFDFILLDTPSGLIDLITVAANSSDMSIIVLNSELTSISDAFGLFKHLTKINRKRAVHVLNNRVQNSGESDFIFQKFSLLADRFLSRVPLSAGYLPEDKKLTESIAQQKPFFEISANSAAWESFLQLRDLLFLRDSEGTKTKEIINERSINRSGILADIKE